MYYQYIKYYTILIYIIVIYYIKETKHENNCFTQVIYRSFSANSERSSAPQCPDITDEQNTTKTTKNVCCEISVLLYMYRILVANCIHAEQKGKEAVTILLLGLTDAWSSSNVHLLLDDAFAWLLEDFFKCTCTNVHVLIIYFLMAAEIIYNRLNERNNLDDVNEV